MTNTIGGCHSTSDLLFYPFYAQLVNLKETQSNSEKYLQYFQNKLEGKCSTLLVIVFYNEFYYFGKPKSRQLVLLDCRL